MVLKKLFIIHLEFVLKKLLYKSFVLMFVQCQNCKRLPNTFYSLQFREKVFS